MERPYSRGERERDRDRRERGTRRVQRSPGGRRVRRIYIESDRKRKDDYSPSEEYEEIEESIDDRRGSRYKRGDRKRTEPKKL